MDIATIAGIVGGLGLIVAAIGGANLPFFISIPSVLVVMGGTFAAVMVNYPFKDILTAIAVVKKTIFGSTENPEKVIPLLVELGQKARRDGILVLQNETGRIANPFLQKGIQLAIDGMEPQVINAILENEIDNVKGRHKSGYEIILTFGTFAPAFGMIGTLIGLVLMLQQMDDPSKIGPSMSIALITTFYGAVLANLVFIPMAGKLKKKSSDEILILELSLEGVVSIAAGDNPRILEQKLHGYLMPKFRKSSFK
ncbi:MAG: MotA/TolQ/ExbB proton channel family protein [Nitrospinota bacterium]|nr:MotA/TolQ/ExbB proton channel family protein [Nitrospinota bacterium]